MTKQEQMKQINEAIEETKARIANVFKRVNNGGDMNELRFEYDCHMDALAQLIKSRDALANIR